MIILDAFLRFSGVGILLLTSVLILKDLKHSSSALYLFLAGISITCHFLGFTPEIFAWPDSFRMMFRFLDIFQLSFIWLFALSLFEKTFRLKPFHISVVLVYSFLQFAERLVQFNYLNPLPVVWGYTVNILSLVLVVHMIAVTLLGRSDDLIEKRRRSRLYLVFVTAFSAITTVIFGSVLFSQYQQTIDVICLWPSIIWVSYWLISVDEHKFSFDEQQKKTDKKFSTRDVDLQEKLQFEMTQKKGFLENNLSIETLATRLGVSEYRLRAFINQTLGYKNFSTYVNVYRIKAIKDAFNNIDNEHIPILSIAMANGFNSLSPFNRAFKNMEGMTPTEFRRKIKELN